MTLLNVEFDVVSHDPHANAKASMMVMLTVEGYAGPYAALPASGTSTGRSWAKSPVSRVGWN